MRFQLQPFAALRVIYFALFAGLASSVLLVPQSRAQGLVSTDLYRLRSVGAVVISPDNRLIAYTVIMRDRPGRPYSQVWIMDPGTQRTVRVGAEKEATSNPIWSP